VQYCKASDTLESFLSKVAFESDSRKKTCTCVMKTFASFLLSKETFTIRTCSILESFFCKLLSKATFERKLSSVSLPLGRPLGGGCVQACLRYMSCRTGRLLLTDGAQSQTAQQVGVQSSHSSQHSLDAVFPIVDIHADCIDITSEYKCPRGTISS